MTAIPDDWEEMTEKQANEEGVFDCPTCGGLRDASELMKRRMSGPRRAG
jgi:hypothetical protein